MAAVVASIGCQLGAMSNRTLVRRVERKYRVECLTRGAKQRLTQLLEMEHVQTLLESDEAEAVLASIACHRADAQLTG